MEFGSVALNVAVLLVYAIPGYLFIKLKVVKSDTIPAFAKLLLFVCQPCLSIYTFQKVTYSLELFKKMAIFFALSIALQIFMLLLLRLIFIKKYDDVKYKIANVASVLGNCGFFGVPLLESLLPDYPEAMAYAAVFIIAFNIIAWTLGAYLLTGDKRFIASKKAFLNPPVLTLFISLPLFFTQTTLPGVISNAVTILAKFTTPLCMFILGMRFATANVKELFTTPTVYISSIAKLIVFPLLAFLVTHWLPIDYAMKATIYILCCCPSASVILGLSEITDNGGQKYAAYSLLASTIFCMITIPVLLLIL